MMKRNISTTRKCAPSRKREHQFSMLFLQHAAIRNSKKKNSPESLPGVSVAGTVLLKQCNTQMNAGFAKILGFLIRSKSLEVRSYFLLLFILFLIGKNGNNSKQSDCACAYFVCYF